MPIYRYKCRECGHETEKLAPMSASNPTCEGSVSDADEIQCGGETVKVPSQSTFHLKGGGWEKDGYGDS